MYPRKIKIAPIIKVNVNGITIFLTNSASNMTRNKKTSMDRFLANFTIKTISNIWKMNIAIEAFDNPIIIAAFYRNINPSM
ncbi:hypothetical protein BTM29_01200 [Companilactobacillus allii]|uniref:Uncharacterized protein n=2 Tax=Companilactobacillus allii TaxID=1847728 RepID=A0A1P8Q0A1_9LACO|nr:hypothetical protein [Companilactobacillus allii]APX71251.1 hypothetical protein BTM29_01200 [Companilactobacillus allii]